jgi:hypothetical protein
MDEIIENGIPRKTELVQAETRARFHEVRDLRGAIRTLLFAAPGRAAAEERAFGRILDDHPVYAALWGYGVIGMTPPGLESRLRTISIADTGTRATRIRDAMVEASLGDVDLRNTLFEMGFDPDRDRGLSIGQIKEKLYDVHGPYPVDGYKLYYSVTQPASVDRAVSYFKSDTVGEAVGTYCPAG